MSQVLEKNRLTKGGEFLIQKTTETFVPENRNEEQAMFMDVARSFINQHIEPNKLKIEKQENNISSDLMEVIGELGLLAAHMPEEYEGLELDENTNTLISDVLGPMGSFNTTLAAHTGIGMLPILYYGTEDHKKKYLPKLGTGEWKAAYCLTEPSSGSDALSAKTVAHLTSDGKHYEITGQKMWISNAGFAKVFIVFAQVDGDKFTGFVVEGPCEGMTLGEEEDKLGIKGSSTRQVYFEKVKVPVDNVLGEIGKGHLIAFNTLNIGRFKLGTMCTGGTKSVISMAVKYANERIQFKQPISNFGAIQHKIAEMAIRTLAVESSVYRTSDLMQKYSKVLQADGVSYGEAKRASAEEYAIECSIIKVSGSETASYAVDENVQIHGGIGFSEEYGAARAYRDNRITRIYEGTNEINRLLIVDMILKRAMKGKLDIVGPAWEVQKELKSMPKFTNLSTPLAQEIKAVEDFKKVVLMVAGAAAKEQMEGKLNLKNEQMLLTFVSDIIIDAFNCESMLLRVQKLKEQGHEHANLIEEALKVYMHDSNARIAKNALDAVSSFASGDLHKIFSMGIQRFTAYPAINVVESRRKIAKAIIDGGEYIFFK
jgi:alkylation response protein AidB-like acyl-CoA dehydrogenase